MTTSKTTTEPSMNKKNEKGSTIKLDTIRDIERQMQQKWADMKVFEADAPVNYTDK